MSQQLELPLSDIKINPVSLRDVDKESDKYQNLVHSIKKRGLLLPITVVQETDEATSEIYYLLVDGLHRFTACQDTDCEKIAVHVLDISADEVIETQIAANLIKIDTKPIEFTKGIQRMMQMKPTMTINDVAEKVSQSVSWVKGRLSLMKLEPAIQELVDAGDICIANAVVLAKMPPEEVGDWLTMAQTQSPAEFMPPAQERIKELKAAAKEGREATKAEYTPKPRMRKMGDMKTEMETGEIGPQVVADADITTADEGFALGLAWALHMDPASLSEGQEKWDAQQRAKDESKARAKAIREAKKQKEAQENAAKAMAESGMSEEEVEAAIAAQDEEE